MQASREYFRLSGAGNDFLALVEPERYPEEAEIRAWCRRGLSAGADGLFILSRDEPAAGGNGAPAVPRVTLAHFNADGRPAALCINGLRCAVRLAGELGWTDGRIAVATGAGVIAAELVGAARVAVELPTLKRPLREVTLEVDGRLWEGWLALAGVPHLVLPWSEPMAAAPVAEVGPRLRNHPALGPAGANVDFVGYRDPARFEIRTFERGVEAETLACGTGVMAAAAVGLHTRRSTLPLTALTRGGAEMAVDGEPGERRVAVSWRLTAEARLVARGTLEPEASQLPTPPGW